MRLSVIVDDGIVILNGEPHVCELPVIEGLKAVQCDDSVCEAEWKNAPNSEEPLAFAEQFVAAWNDGKAKREAEINAMRAEVEAFRNTYSEKRRRAYPSVGDQLDAMYHAGMLPEELAAQIAAVKEQYPKGIS